MGMVVRTNTMANNAFRQLGMNNSQVSKSLEKLASGYRINRAGDDAAGLAVSESMKAQITGLEAASSNSQDAISLVQTAEGALTEVHSMLNRMVELATKAANGTYTDTQRGNYQDEITKLQEEIDRISKTTKFNGQTLLDGSVGGVAKAKAAAPTPINNITGTWAGAAISSADTAATKGNFSTGAVTGGSTGASGSVTVKYTDSTGQEQSVTVQYATDANSATNATNMKNALDAALSGAFTVGGDENGITFEAKTAGSKVNITEFKVTGDTNNTSVTATGTPGKDAGKSFNLSATPQAGDTVTIDGKTYTFAAGADGSDGKTFKDLASLKAAAAVNGVTLDTTTNTAVTAEKAGGNGDGLQFQVGATADEDNILTLTIGDMGAAALGVDTVDVSTVKGAQDAIAAINAAIDNVSSERSNLGAMQNRLEHTINNLDTTAENLSAANSRIRDTDMAKEMMKYTQMNVLVQSAQAMLAQANQQPQSVLQLLQ